MRFPIILVSTVFVLSFFAMGLKTTAPKPQFPDDWLGTWKGTLRLERAGDTSAREFPMELRIQETDTTGNWDWIIIYGEGEKADVRQYSLIAQDSALSHFVIDEHNSIVLDQYLVGNRMFSRFSVDSTMLTVVYRLEGDVLYSEMWTGHLGGNRTGENLPAEENYTIFSFPFKTVQLCTLYRKR
ncbi:MAG: hypothetical protein AB8F95_06895 [Bacteroidia bacterium]